MQPLAALSLLGCIWLSIACGQGATGKKSSRRGAQSASVEESSPEGAARTASAALGRMDVVTSAGVEAWDALPAAAKDELRAKASLISTNP